MLRNDGVRFEVNVGLKFAELVPAAQGFHYKWLANIRKNYRDEDDVSNGV